MIVLAAMLGIAMVVMAVVWFGAADPATGRSVAPTPTTTTSTTTTTTTLPDGVEVDPDHEPLAPGADETTALTALVVEAAPGSEPVVVTDDDGVIVTARTEGPEGITLVVARVVAGRPLLVTRGPSASEPDPAVALRALDSFRRDD